MVGIRSKRFGKCGVDGDTQRERGVIPLSGETARPFDSSEGACASQFNSGHLPKFWQMSSANIPK